MITICKNCNKKLTLSNKIKKGIAQLAPGRLLRLPCPQCGKAIVLDATSIASENNPSRTLPKKLIRPPSPPDISWLKEGVFEEEEVVEDIPQTLILIQPGPDRDKVTEAVESIGYQASFAESDEEAIGKMQFVNYASVILHTDFRDGTLEESPFHQFMCDMSMLKRRFIFYILIGSEFSTLYDLEALSNSANLVVNTEEIPELLTILRKAIPRYEELFGSLMAELNAYSG
ncbi:hypothetical protein UWK_00504 [Desulfocapsa sulfexigens DSM 10523]|uniref:Zinc finger/thioredoxin putative domain-containing protein n=1 Tax=Desulfocapsa sulfexigens (strain DSM 10523 / SB164P1) TaxID=1167006 RepID=M1P5Y0_DESSD|nr:hypothetical protein [Desulfocapsa sulfexigens]AGF77087.1 hypothetical protein UWK_00504 [Desulfocapsa sulfexigens DSM 10523]